MSKSIIQLVDELPTGGITVSALRSLDFVAPGEWHNLVGFKNTVMAVTGEDDPGLIQDISERALWLYNDQDQGYQRAIWLFQTIDSADAAIGAAALANKIGEKISFLGFLNQLTPKADTVQTIDLCLKVVVELVAFCQINGIPGDSIGDFLGSLANYGKESMIRMAGLVCFDGLIPLGPDFIQKASSNLAGLSPSSLEQNDTFKKISTLIPGGSSAGKLDFIGQTFGSVQGWMGNLVSSRGLNPQNVVSNLQSFVEIADDKLDYLAAFLDMATNYYEHTGTQTVARCL
ncbi:hypothetical protein, partial [Limnofasciculus baicalensis]